ncbi:MAG: FG-GAP-like repeat-containing protein, partial [Bifidobacteriaceae bacterium]|nr:FG-GAP-like repeat-containing protein [Bifidobacteriaceae bacterium]
TEWFELDAADGPDPASAEGRRARAGTEPLVAAGSTAVQIQVLSAPGGELPAGLAPAVVPLDPGEVDPDPSSAGQTDAVAGGGPGASAPLGQTLGASTTASNTQPTVNPRSKWNAAPADYSGNTPKGQPVLADKLSGAIIHHQAGSNVYTEAQVPGVIRSIQSWHMGNNGWDDIGYNFLVDKYGGIWEGREGGIDQNVVGAHAFEFNTGTTGVCFLGSMETAQPSAAALDAAGRLVAWRLGLAGIASLKGQTVYPNDPLKQSKPIVAGHRDVNATTCPGRYLYAKLDFIRSYQPIPALTRRVAQSVLSPDLDGDGRGEILAVDDLGALLMFPMTSATQLGPAVQIGSGWTGYTLLAPGDWNGDGIGDLMSVDPAGRLILYPGDGELGFSSQRIGWGWTGYAPTVSPDLDGDGCPDILAIKLSSHVLYLYRGDGKGGFKQSAGQRVGSGWQGWELHAAGDLGGDKLGDIFGVSPDGLLYSYQGVKGGGFGPRARVGSGWNGWRLMAGADLTGDSRPDIAGLEKTKRFVNVYEWLKAGWFAAPVQVAEDW